MAQEMLENRNVGAKFVLRQLENTREYLRETAPDIIARMEADIAKIADKNALNELKSKVQLLLRQQTQELEESSQTIKSLSDEIEKLPDMTINVSKIDRDSRIWKGTTILNLEKYLNFVVGVVKEAKPEMSELEVMRAFWGHPNFLVSSNKNQSLTYQRPGQKTPEEISQEIVKTSGGGGGPVQNIVHDHWCYNRVGDPNFIIGTVIPTEMCQLVGVFCDFLKKYATANNRILYDTTIYRYLDVFGQQPMNRPFKETDKWLQGRWKQIRDHTRGIDQTALAAARRS